MLTSLQIKNFAIVSELNIDWRSGMTAITGETGAGKSIAIDALSLCLGERADANAIRPESSKAEISAQFDIRNLPQAQKFLSELLLDDEEQNCILRRVVTRNGRSKSFINGTSVTAAQLKELGQMLIAIHGQHAHQLLLKPEHQLGLLDAYAGHQNLLGAVKAQFNHYYKLQREHANLLKQQQAQAAKKQLLEYQVEELDEFALQEGEFEQIEAEHNRLSHAQTLVESSQRELMSLYEQDDQTVLGQLQHSVQTFSELSTLDKSLEGISQMLSEAAVQLEEACREIRSYGESVEQDPIRLQEIEERITQAMALSRKHQIQPDQLASHHLALKQELDNICSDNARIDDLEHEIAEALHAYHISASQLSDSRANAAGKLNTLITQSMHELSMENGRFAIELSKDADRRPNELGMDNIEFLVSTNPGQPMQALAKVASGGELSRISLAIQVIIANKVTTPTLIFDEVDVGISGPTASQVGKQLRLLGNSTQVICVTHLPQVACSGHQQFFVQKAVNNAQTYTSMVPLDMHQRVDEIARLLGGDSVSDTTRASAKELLSVQSC
ncbi:MULTISPECIES: DNA repair protein RecN [Pseudoalteromonas]|uniref:DNA repair protein RecN n=1 Tax=Pseudoalteromonas luteoviolacea (strain 2ta16) TaxID=1353533 RepID=V4J4L6_PSEL2|nr:MULTISPECIES: DNA repair protein RecN [Pseudoalteromonas]ESP90292.1 DNA repair protein RecN [Pseudoalteromonas luteoviolacea 2ta16]KZN39931.1 recombinase [Pseudoalteromonas luteoviolacea NCIMB 1944]MCG7546996.1 DNA repair protein RecN [Pseudoalteromonas sp. Of7M-16]